MDVKIEESWKEHLQQEFEKPYFRTLTDFVRKEYAARTVYPPAKLIFNAFDSCPFNKVKVVIVGQDPYHEPGQAHGLCFSVNDGVQIPPSLVNIYKEIEDDLGIPAPRSGDLTRWAKQGVLLLNATLTVQAHHAGSHQGKGWEEFTDAAIKRLAEERDHLVFILWGAYAQRKGASIDANRHLILKSPHPSPLSAHRGFFGNKHFSKANDYLSAHNMEPVRW
ncbi:Uracil-DNA glycosylase [Porphyromonadaceae bacterium NLAE-zl-C104]|uniref:uracil-DNA glycosylase n=1 Tax=Proteiniphilum saccharofermentans TaxID=1642647 RepID=UPI000898DD5B|nr:uracil-DNA glycosylase [Proteiniphilum saccharofermentans]SEA40605.1 Uracil-DNA glycosylase [Porphyromonadaceae bacterium KH3R12]SFS50371.1 Uracil-DNA glycosylase [Porphyromonadaceae bacterium NLAE-zl-C104]